MDFKATLVTKRIILIFSCLAFSMGFGLIPLIAQPVFHSEALENIFYSLPQEVKNQISRIEPEHDTTSYFNVILNGYEVVLIYRFNQFNEIAHLGINIQSPISEQDEVGFVIQYLERCILKWMILNSNIRILEDMHTELITMRLGGELVDVNFREGIISYFNKIQVAKDLQIKSTNNMVSVTWTFDLFNNIEINFPNDLFAISGKRKDEFENELFRSLKHLPIGEIKKITPPIENLIAIDHHLFVLHSSIYEDSEEITSNIYFIKDSDLEPVFSSLYPLESISNLMHNTIKSYAEINISVSIYGQLTNPISVNINDLMSFLSKGNEVYIGWKGKDQTNLKASIFIHNNYFNYTHLLLIQLNAEKFFYQNEGLTGILYSYIPKLNLRSE